MTNCQECKWCYDNACREIRAIEGCFECDNFDNDKLECKCTDIEDLDNCPNFEPYEQN